MNKKQRDPNDKIIEQLEQIAGALGSWNKSLVLGGGVALVVYARCMAKSHTRPVGTLDVDFLIPRRPVVPVDSESVADILEKLGFTLRHKTLDVQPIQSFVKDIGDFELEVEFLTDNRARSKGDAVVIKGAGVVAQTLSYLEMSLDCVMTATLSSGTEITVVAPEAWVFHKGLIFLRRKPGSFKRYKDLYGIWFVLTQMGDFSATTALRLSELQAKRSSKWVMDFRENLSSWVKKATPRDWEQLAAQDPERHLTEASFRHLVERLTV